MKTDSKPDANDISDLMGEPTMSISIIGEARRPEHVSPASPVLQLFNASGFTRLLAHGKPKVLRSGVTFEVPAGKVMLVYPAHPALEIAGGVVVIDSNNHMEAVVSLSNKTTTDFDLEANDPIAHAIIIDAQRWALSTDV